MKKPLIIMTIALMISQSLTITGLANTDNNIPEMVEPVSEEWIDHELEQTREELLALIKEIEDKITNNELIAVEFTVETWSNLTSALNIARNITKGDSSATVDLQWAMLTLENSLENLERISWDALLAEYHDAYDTLTIAIGEAESLHSESTWYTEASWAHFIQGLEVAKTALEDSSVGTTISEVKQEISKLEDARNQLNGGVSSLDFDHELISEKLNEIVDEIQGYISELENLNLESTRFTEASWSQFLKVYDYTKNVNSYPEESNALAKIAHMNYLQECLDSLKVAFEELELVKANEAGVAPGIEKEPEIDSDSDVGVKEPVEERVTNQPESDSETDLPRSGQLRAFAPIIGGIAVVASFIIIVYKSNK